MQNHHRIPCHFMILGVFLLLFLGSQCSDERSSETVIRKPTYRPTVHFFRIPECFLCVNIHNTLESLQKEHDKQLTFRELDYHSPASQKMIARFHLGHHGVVITDPQGAELWSMPAHNDQRESLTEAIKRIAEGKALASPPPS